MIESTGGLLPFDDVDVPAMTDGCWPQPKLDWDVQYDAFNYILCKKLDDKAIPPAQGKLGDAGYDLYAVEDVVVPGLFNRASLFCRDLWNNLINFRFSLEKLIEFQIPEFAATKVRTGIALEIPIGHVGLIMDRSGMGSKLIKVFGGVLDSNYRGEVIVCLANFTFKDHHIKAGDRVAQFVVQECKSYPVCLTDKLSESNREDKGFGSSGA